MTLRLLPRLTVVVVLCYVAVDRAVELVLHGLGDVQEVAAEATLMGVLTSAGIWATVIGPFERSLARAQAARLDAAHRTHRLQNLQARLGRGLDMATTETACYEVLRLGLEAAAPRMRSDLMLADSSEAHLTRTVTSTSGADRAPCDVASPQDCPAVRRAQPLVFTSGAELDACPYLRVRGGEPVGAACLPVSVAGRSIGVVHATTARAGEPCPDEVEALGVLADLAGSRIGMLRVLSQTSLQAATDPLTGLLNRRSLESVVGDLTRRREQFAVAMIDLDHFKTVNDVHGHETGDRALRLFARTLAAGVRAQDVVCRYGGEEFLVILPGCTAEQAAAIFGRVAETLARALLEGSLPSFTASYGIADTTDAVAYDALLALADNALLEAKRSGRDRVLLAHSGSRVAVPPGPMP